MNNLQTNWSQIRVMAEADNPQYENAWKAFCDRYRPVMIGRIRAHGFEEAQVSDLLQEFYFYLLGKEVIKQADPALGRFRSFLCTCLNRFLVTQIHRNNREKRGGKATKVPLTENLPDEEAASDFRWDVEWALMIFQQAVEATRQVWGDRKEERFSVLQKFLPGATERISQEEAARRLGMSLAAVITAIHRLKKDYRICLREVVAATVEHPEDVDGEMRFLRQVLSKGLWEQS